MKDFFQGVLMQLPALISVLRGKNHIIELVNPPAQELIGERNVIGKSVREAFPEFIDQGFFELLDNVYETGEVYTNKSMPATLLRKGETVNLFVDVAYLPLRDSNGEIAGVISFSYDVTEAVLAKNKLNDALEDLKYSFEDLEVKVKFRNLELEKANSDLQNQISILSGGINNSTTPNTSG